MYSQIHYDPLVTSQSDLVAALIAAERAIPPTMTDVTFPGRRLTFPIVLDDKWCKMAMEKYMREVRDQAVYLPSNIEYLARNNAVEGGVVEALQRLVASDWVRVRSCSYEECCSRVVLNSSYSAWASTLPARSSSR